MARPHAGRRRRQLVTDADVEWHVVGSGIASSAESPSVEDEVWDLIGHQIVSFTAGPEVIDPTFHLTGGLTLTERADSDWDPWVLKTPGLVIVGRRA